MDIVKEAQEIATKHWSRGSKPWKVGLIAAGVGLLIGLTIWFLIKIFKLFIPKPRKELADMYLPKVRRF